MSRHYYPQNTAGQHDFCRAKSYFADRNTLNPTYKAPIVPAVESFRGLPRVCRCSRGRHQVFAAANPGVVIMQAASNEGFWAQKSRRPLCYHELFLAKGKDCPFKCTPNTIPVLLPCHRGWARIMRDSSLLF